MLKIWKATLFEGLGSGSLVWLVGTSSTALGVGDSVETGVTLGVLYALATSLAMYAIGPLTGGHINPFITLATMAAGTFPLVRGAAYVVAHILGSMAGGALVAAALGANARSTGNGGCVLRSVDTFSVQQAFALEFAACLLLLILVNGTGLAHQQIRNHGHRLAPILLGLSVGIVNFATSGFANTHAYIGSAGYPNVCFGLAAGIMQFQSTHWVFWIPGFVAVILFGLVYRLLQPYEEWQQEQNERAMNPSYDGNANVPPQNSILAPIDTQMKSPSSSDQV